MLTEWIYYNSFFLVLNWNCVKYFEIKKFSIFFLLVIIFVCTGRGIIYNYDFARTKYNGPILHVNYNKIIGTWFIDSYDCWLNVEAPVIQISSNEWAIKGRCSFLRSSTKTKRRTITTWQAIGGHDEKLWFRSKKFHEPIQHSNVQVNEVGWLSVKSFFTYFIFLSKTIILNQLLVWYNRNELTAANWNT